MNKILKFSLVGIAALGAAYLAGPRPNFDPATTEPVVFTTELTGLDTAIAQYEGQFKLKPDNQARIVWADSTRKQKTPYSLVYIHGFSASWGEGNPVNLNLARQFGCNLYLTRNAGHGLDSPDAMQDLTPASYLASAERALAIGKTIGEKVIVIGTSMGGMLTLYLAEHHPEIAGLVLYSPCIAVADPRGKLITGPWGKTLLNQIQSDHHFHVKFPNPERIRYWYDQYHTNGLLTLQTVLDEHVSAETFGKIKQPVFLGYYYKDEDHQDHVVSVEAMLKMYDQLGTPANLKRKEAFPEAEDHVLTSNLTTKTWPAVQTSTVQFMQEVLKLPLAPTATPTLASIPKK